MASDLNFGELLRDCRKRAGLGLRELARLASISVPFLSDIELGRRMPSDAVLDDLATALGDRSATLRHAIISARIAQLQKRIDELEAKKVPAKSRKVKR